MAPPIVYPSFSIRPTRHCGPNDVDVLIIGTPDRADAYDAADHTQGWLGTPVNPIIRTPEQWADGADSLIHQIKDSPTLDVTPSPAVPT